MKHILVILLILSAMPLHAQQKSDTSLVAFEQEYGELIATEMIEDEASASAEEINPLAYAGHNEGSDMIENEVSSADTHYHGWVAKVVRWYDTSMNYVAVGALMTLESSFVPFPSEIVIPPAVMVSADPGSDNDMKIWIIVLFGTLGALLGAYINYFLSRWLGRPIIYKFVDSKLGHALSLSAEKMERAEKYFNEHGVVSTLVGRLIPVIRQLISIPAGLSKMNVGVFTFYTFLGAAIWNCVLALLGFLAVKAGGMNFIFKYSSLLSKLIIVLFVVAIGYLIVRSIIKKRKK